MSLFIIPVIFLFGILGMFGSILSSSIATSLIGPLSILSIMSAGLLMISGALPIPWDWIELGKGLATRRARTPSRLAPAARAASERVAVALGRLLAMPVEAFTPEARLEYQDIRDKHLPDLRAAHDKARKAFPVDGPETLALDAELAGSLDLILAKLDELITNCGNEARSGFDVERRFVEIRHPADPLENSHRLKLERGEGAFG